MIYGIRTGYFDVVAHPDRIFRRCREWTEGCNHIAREIGVSAARQAMPLENSFTINNSCLYQFAALMKSIKEPHIILSSTWRVGYTSTGAIQSSISGN